MPNTAKYCLKKDRKTQVDVIIPIYGIATIVKPDGSREELKKDDFNALYEPVLAAPNLKGVDLTAPGGKLSQRMDDISDSQSELHGKIDALHIKLDKLLAVALPPDHGEQHEG